MVVQNNQRFLFGAGEAGCFPNVTKAFTTWLPKPERVRAQGIMWLSARWGGAFTPLIVGWMLARGGPGCDHARPRGAAWTWCSRTPPC